MTSVKIYTIGFTKKSAEKFFELLRSNGINKIIDTRINSESQLSGFAKGKDLKYFAKEILGIDYEHNVEFAPTKQLLEKYRKKNISWDEYENEYLSLLEGRRILDDVVIENLNNSCLLCSEEKPTKCHRRLLAEYLNQKYKQVRIIHLI